jgi:peroxiredoxin
MIPMHHRIVSQLVLTILSVTMAFAQNREPEHTNVVTPVKVRFDSIVKSQNELLERYGAELKAADGDEDGQRKAMDRYVPAAQKNATAALELVRDNLADPIAVEALRFVIKTARAGPGDESKRAIEILDPEYVRAPKMGRLCQEIIYFFHLRIAESLIRDVLEQHPDREDRGLACHALAYYLQYRARMVRKFQETPEIVKEYEETCGKGAVAWVLRDKAPAVLDAEVEKLLERVVKEFGMVPSGSDQRTLGAIAEGELFALRHLHVGKTAPEIEGRDDEGNAFRLSDYRGKVVVLTFSGNWCGPCKAMYPQQRDLIARFKDRPFAIVSVDTDEEKSSLRTSIESKEITWRCWWDGGMDGPITTRWGVSRFPSIFVLDPQGVIRFIELRGEPLDKAVDALLKESP